MKTTKMAKLPTTTQSATQCTQQVAGSDRSVDGSAHTANGQDSPRALTHGHKLSGLPRQEVRRPWIRRFGGVALVIGLIAALAIGCNRAHTVSGQVFVVTRGGENFKLGLVGIHAIGEKELSAIAHDVLEELSAGIAKRADVDARRAANIDLLSAFESGIENLIQPGLPAPEALTLAQESKKRRQQYLEARDWIPILAPGAIEDRLFSSLPDAATKTDADGQFTIPVGRGCWLIARAERMAGSDQERYLWAVPPEKAQGRIMVANDTLVTDTTALLLTLDPTSSPPPSSLTPIKGEADASLQAWVGEAMAKAESEVMRYRKPIEDARRTEIAGATLAFEQLEAKVAALAPARPAESAKAPLQKNGAPITGAEREGDGSSGALARHQLLEAIKSGTAGTAATLGSSADVKFTVRFIPSGSFVMGSNEAEEGYTEQERRHQVTLTHSFFMAETECTQAQWRSLLPATRCTFDGDARPVEMVDWSTAVEFCERLTDLHKSMGLIPESWEWRLPTEAQWEYACRAGSTGAFAGEPSAMAWYATYKTQPVAGKQANAWGLFDMHGNVSEWCQDNYAIYPTEAVIDPRGDGPGSLHISRGGAYNSQPEKCRSGYRNRNDGKAKTVYPLLGFRLVLVLER